MSYNARQSFGMKLKLQTSAGADAVAASKTFGTGDSAIVFTARTVGVAGNSITITIVDSDSLQDTVVAVSGTDITITPANDGTDIIATVNDVIAEVLADEDASALVSVTNGAGDGTGVIAAAAETALENGAAGTAVFTEIPGLGDVDIPGLQRALLEFTNHGSTDGYAEFVKSGVKEGREITFPLYYDPSNTVHQALSAAEASDDATKMQFIFPFSGEDFQSDILVLDISKPAPVRGMLMSNVRCQLTGAPLSI